MTAFDPNAASAEESGVFGLPHTREEAAVVLVRFEGLSYKQTADVLGITEGAVESRLVRAMRRLEAAQEAAGSGVSPGERAI